MSHLPLPIPFFCTPHAPGGVTAHRRWKQSHAAGRGRRREGRIRCGVQSPSARFLRPRPFTVTDDGNIQEQAGIRQHASVPLSCALPGLHVYRFSPIFPNWVNAATVHPLRGDDSCRSQQSHTVRGAALGIRLGVHPSHTSSPVISIEDSAPSAMMIPILQASKLTSREVQRVVSGLLVPELGSEPSTCKSS